MTGEHTQAVLARIDAALARITAASAKVELQMSAHARRHDHLREAVAQTLHDLDLLIAEQAGADGGTGEASGGAEA